MEFLSPSSIFRTLRALAVRPITTIAPRAVIHAFHMLWYHSPETWRKNTFLGYEILQLPMDIWLYQELVHRERPGCIIQTGVAGGGSILFFAHLFDVIQAPPSALVIGVDLSLSTAARTLSHPRIRLVEGDSVARVTVERVKSICDTRDALVILDSDHRSHHVRQELELYSPFVRPGRHLVVEDTNVNGHPVYLRHGPGPFEAVEHFLRTHPEFERDDELWKRNLFSFHQHGWLRRLADKP